MAAAETPAAFVPLRDRVRMLEPSPVVAPASRPQPVSRIRRVSSAVGYGLLGFVFGAIFWHFVGFWDFLGQVMLKGPPNGGEVAAARPIKLRDRVSGSAPLAVVVEPAACTALHLDRGKGMTSVRECEPEAAPLPLRSLKSARREDRWVTAEQRIQQTTARGWSMVTVETAPKLQEQVSWD